MDLRGACLLVLLSLFALSVAAPSSLWPTPHIAGYLSVASLQQGTLAGTHARSQPQTYGLPGGKGLVLRWQAEEELCAQLAPSLPLTLQPVSALCAAGDRSVHLPPDALFVTFFSMAEEGHVAYSAVVEEAGGEEQASRLAMGRQAQPQLVRKVAADEDNEPAEQEPNVDKRVSVFIICVLVICGGLMLISTVVFVVWLKRAYDDLKDSEGVALIKGMRKKEETL